MPRGTVLRQNSASQYDDDDFMDDAPDDYPRSQSDTSSSPPSPVQAMNSKKKHYCATCGRSFTTSGHLARHSRVHTGERNHKCPFPGCQTRCSRQDNLQQHYRIHLSPGSRRGSSASARAALKKMAIETAEGSSDEHPRSRSVYRRTNPFPPLSAPPSAAPPSTFGAEIYEGARASSLSPPPDTPPPLVPARPQPHILTNSYSTSSGSSASPSPHSDIGSQNVQAGIVDPAPVLMHSPQEPAPRPYSMIRSGTISYEEQAKVVAPPIASYLDSSRQLFNSPVGQPSADNQRYHYAGSSAYTSAPSPVSPVRPHTSHTGYHIQAPQQISPVESAPYHHRSYETNQNAPQPLQAMQPADQRHQTSSDMYVRYPSQSTSRHSLSHISQPQYAPSGNSHPSSSTSAPQAISPLTSERAHQVPGDHISQPTLEAAASFSANEGSFHGVYTLQGEMSDGSSLSGAVGAEYSYTYRRESDRTYHPENLYQTTQSQPPSAPPSRYPSPPTVLPPPPVRRELRVDIDVRPTTYVQYRAPQSQPIVQTSVNSYSQYSQPYGSSELMPYLHQPQPVVPAPQYQSTAAPEMEEDWNRTAYTFRVRHAT